MHSRTAGLFAYDPTMEIRPATPQDVPAVLPMVAKLCTLHEVWDQAKYGFRFNVTDMYRGWLTARATDPRSVFIVAERPASGDALARVVGFLVATIEREIPIYRLDDYGFIHDVWIDPDYRHEGVGREMVMHAVESFHRLKVSQIRLDTAHPNDAARALFASCGFRVSAVEMLHDLGASP